MTGRQSGIPKIKKVLTIMGALVIALGFWSVTIRTGTNTITVGSSSFNVGIYPYFTYGAIIVLIGIGLVASGLIYSPKNPKYN